MNVFEKYRKPRKPVEKERKEWQYAGAQPILFGMDMCETDKPLILTEGQCFPHDAEILTENGWVDFAHYDGVARIMSVDEHLEGHFVKPLAIIKKPYHGDLLACRIGGNYTSIVTPDHNMVFVDRKRRIRKIPACEVKPGTGLWVPTAIRVRGPGIS